MWWLALCLCVVAGGAAYDYPIPAGASQGNHHRSGACARLTRQNLETGPQPMDAALGERCLAFCTGMRAYRSAVRFAERSAPDEDASLEQCAIGCYKYHTCTDYA